MVVIIYKKELMVLLWLISVAKMQTICHNSKCDGRLALITAQLIKA